MEQHPSRKLLEELLRQKEERRRQLARLPIEDKVAIINRMIEMVRPVTEQNKKRTP
jgi:hypothetical protein